MRSICAMPLWGYYYHWQYLRASWYFCYVLDVVGAVVVAAAVDTTKIHVPVLLEVSIFLYFMCYMSAAYITHKNNIKILTDREDFCVVHGQADFDNALVPVNQFKVNV